MYKMYSLPRTQGYPYSLAYLKLSQLLLGGLQALTTLFCDTHRVLFDVVGVGVPVSPLQDFRLWTLLTAFGTGRPVLDCNTWLELG